jgi:DNA (cytosine-5)-methyltransferase 1
MESCVTNSFLQLILSIFPGIDLLGRAFEEEGFCVVRGPDLIWGGDVRNFHVPRGQFAGVIGGSPCPDFSRLRRTSPTGYGVEMIGEFVRIVREAVPNWFLMENVPGVPDLLVPDVIVDYSAYGTVEKKLFPYGPIQRIDIDGRECGLNQRRLRHFQFGSHYDKPLVVPRDRSPSSPSSVTDQVFAPAAVASEARRAGRRDWTAFCGLQGVEALELPGMSVAAKYAAVGNGVPLPMGRLLARAIREWRRSDGRGGNTPVCGCGCARPIGPRQTYALPCCRKRMHRRREGRDYAAETHSRGITV